MRALAAVAAVLFYLAGLAFLMPAVAVDALAVGSMLVFCVGAVLAFGERVAP